MTRAGLDVPVVAVVVVRDGRVPAGADQAVAEAQGQVLVVGSGAAAAVESLPSARRAWWAEAPVDSAALAAALAPALAGGPALVVMAASPDGRDLAPRLSVALGWPLLAGAVAARLEPPARVAGPAGAPSPPETAPSFVTADLLRADGRVTVPARVAAPAVVTVWPGAASPAPAATAPEIVAWAVAGPEAMTDAVPNTEGRVEQDRLVEPDPATMDLSDARRVLGGGAGLVGAGTPDEEARAVFALLVEVAAALGASAGATRVITDAGWMPYDRQIGTTGVSVDPDLYVALGVSGASQHTGGLGHPDRVVSVNTDPACPMTAAADLGVVTDARALLVELADRLAVPVPPSLRGQERPAAGLDNHSPT